MYLFLILYVAYDLYHPKNSMHSYNLDYVHICDLTVVAEFFYNIPQCLSCSTLSCIAKYDFFKWATYVWKSLYIQSLGHDKIECY